MFRKNLFVFTSLLILALPGTAQAGPYEMGGTADGSVVTVPVTAYVAGEADVFNSDSCYSSQPPAECVFVSAEEDFMVAKAPTNAQINEMN